MSSKANRGRSACKKAHNNKEWVRISREHSGDCTYCPPNAGENQHGSHSQWGRKRAMKREYATGKGRSHWTDYINRRPGGPSYGNNCYWDKGIAYNLYTVKTKNR